MLLSSTVAVSGKILTTGNLKKKQEQTQSIIKEVLHPTERWAPIGRTGGHLLKWYL